MTWKVKQMIDREAAVKALEDAIAESKNRDGEYSYILNVDAEKTLELLKEQESEWLEDSDPGQEYGTTWACRKCMHSIHEPHIWNPYDSGYKYCPHCGAEMKVKLDEMCKGHKCP